MYAHDKCTKHESTNQVEILDLNKQNSKTFYTPGKEKYNALKMCVCVCVYVSV